jgi:hypothetical protein
VTNDTANIAPPVASRDGRGVGRQRGSDAASSAVNFALLDQQLRPLTRARMLPLASPRSSQLKTGPEDARLVSAAGRHWLVYNDVLPEPRRAGASALAGGAARWRMRRGMYLAELRARGGDAERVAALRPRALHAGEVRALMTMLPTPPSRPSLRLS